MRTRKNKKNFSNNNKHEFFIVQSLNIYIIFQDCFFLEVNYDLNEATNFQIPCMMPHLLLIKGSEWYICLKIFIYDTNLYPVTVKKASPVL